MHIAMDAMGGDSAPVEVVAGAIQAVRKTEDLHITLVGDEDQVRSTLVDFLSNLAPEDRDLLESRLNILHAPHVIGMDESPVESLRRSPDSSIARAVSLVRTGDAHAVVTAGNTGAAVAATHQALGRIKGIRRPGIAVLLPTRSDHPAVVIDVGATVKCQPIHLCHFGIMGNAFARTVLNIDTPRVGLLNIGEEDEKGNELVRRTHELFKEYNLNFLGNIEGQDIFQGKCDVVVCEGFVGNVVLKVTEGMAEFVTHFVAKTMAGDDSPTGQRLMEQLQGKTDFSSYGGAILLGVNGICIIGHGRSGRNALANAIILAAKYTEARVTDRIIEGLKSTSTRNSPEALSR